MAQFLIGIDGGCTSTRAIVARADGAVVGYGRAVPTALGQGVAQSWRNVELAIRKAFQASQLALASGAWTARQFEGAV